MTNMWDSLDQSANEVEYTHSDRVIYVGNSMKGTFKGGDLLRIVSIALTDVRVGDVVVYWSQEYVNKQTRVVHRAVKVFPGALITRGDNNITKDIGIVTEELLIGKVTHILHGEKARPVVGGRQGLLQSRFRYRMRAVQWRINRFLIAMSQPTLAKLYRWFRASGLATMFWHPGITKISLEADYGVVVKYVVGRRVVAYWWPGKNRFLCRRPYDLVLQRPDGREWPT